MITETEAGFTDAVLQLAKLHGWASVHFRPAMTQAGKWVTPVQGDGKGWPDLILCRRDRLIVAELKSKAGRLSEEQSEWLARLRLIPFLEVYLWRPADWSAIEDALA